MFCQHCGQELPEGTRYCTCCGADQLPAPVQSVSAPLQAETPPIHLPHTVYPGGTPKSPKGRYVLFGAGGIAIGAILLAVILLISGVFSSASVGGMIEGAGFSTPEEAAQAYLTGLRDQDINAMISAFAVESYVDHYDFEARVQRFSMYDVSYDMPFPNTNEYTRQLNIETRRSRIVSQILSHYMFYNATDEVGDGYPITLDDPDEVSDFVEDFERDLEDYIFEDLTITSAISLSQSVDKSSEDLVEELLENLPEDLLEALSEDWLENAFDTYMSEINQKNLGEQVAVYGASNQDVANIIVVFESDGDSWLFYPQAIRYDGQWYLQDFQGNLANLLGFSPYLGGLAPIDMNFFE